MTNKRYDLVYIYPQEYNPIRKIGVDVDIPTFNRFIPTVIGALNKVKDFGLETVGYIQEYDIPHVGNFIKNTQSKCYLIDIQNPYCLREAIKFIRAIRYTHSTARIFVVSEFALRYQDVQDALDVDFILNTLIDERLLFLCRKGIQSKTKLFNVSENKLELDRYDYLDLSVFKSRMKLKRKYPWNMILQKTADSDQDKVTQFSTDKVKEMIGEIDNLKISTIYPNVILESLVSESFASAATLIISDQIPTTEELEELVSKFKKIIIEFNIISNDYKNSIIADANDLKDINAISGVSIVFNLTTDLVFPTRIANILSPSDVTDMKALCKTIKSSRKVPKTNEATTLAHYNLWDRELTYDLLHALTKYFKV